MWVMKTRQVVCAYANGVLDVILGKGVYWPPYLRFVVVNILLWTNVAR